MLPLNLCSFKKNSVFVVPQEKYFTDEELMEEYDFTPEFRDTFYEWLTPTRYRKYAVEQDDSMDERVNFT